MAIPLDAGIGWLLTALSSAIIAAYEIVHMSGYSYPAGPAGSAYVISPFDEGVYAETGALIARGFKLYSQIYSAQPPLLPLAISSVDRVFGAGLVEVRWLMLFFALVTAVGVLAIARLTVGLVAGGLAVMLLALAPEFLVYAHAIEEEIPMIALSVVSLALALAWRRDRRIELAAVSGLFFGLAVLTKFLAFALLAPLAVIVVLVAWEASKAPAPGRRGQDPSVDDNPAKGLSSFDRQELIRVSRDAAMFVVGAAVPIVISLLVWGQAEWNQMINDRLGATADQAQIQQGSSLHLLRIFLEVDPGLAIAAGVGAVALLLFDWRVGLILDSWLGATLLLLMEYHPLFGHHLAVLLAPMAAVAGAGVGAAGAKIIGLLRRQNGFAGEKPRLRARSGTVSRAQSIALVLAGLATLAYVGLIPVKVPNYGNLLVGESTGDRTLTRIAAFVKKSTFPNDQIAVADPMICVLAQRPCVPEMVDTSYVRVETGRLSPAISYVLNANASVVVLGRALCLHPYMDGFDQWIQSNYRLGLQVALDAGLLGQCPWQPGTRPVSPHGPAGVYVARPAGTTS